MRSEELWVWNTLQKLLVGSADTLRWVYPRVNSISTEKWPSAGHRRGWKVKRVRTVKDSPAVLGCHVNERGADNVCTPPNFEQKTTHLLESVTTVRHRVVSDRPGRVIVASYHLIKEAAILVLRDDFHTGATA